MKRLVALTIAALALGIGTAGAAGHSTGTPRGVVTFIGDENLLLPANVFATNLLGREHDWVMVDAAHAGSAIRSEGGAFWQDRLAALNTSVQSSKYVIDLGVFDTMSPGTATGPGYADYASKVDWLLAQLKPGVPVLWTNLPCKILPKVRQKGCLAVNAAIGGARARHPELFVLQWAHMAINHPEWIAHDGTGVHYTVRGRNVLAGLILDAV